MRKKPVPPTLCLMLTIPVLWLAVIAASVYENGINVFELVSRLTSAVNHPFAVRWTAYTPRFCWRFYCSTAVVFSCTILAGRIAGPGRSTALPSGAAHGSLTRSTQTKTLQTIRC